ncbi:hypothetical protein D9M73_218740 [compost metagenome]
MGHALGVGVIEKNTAWAAVSTGQEWRPVVEQHCSPGCKGGHKPVPHHPAARTEIEQAIVRMHIGMQLVFLEMLQEGATVTVDNTLGHTGSAGGKQDE